jgi:predicted permease
VLFTLPHFLFWNVIGRVRDGTPTPRAAAELNAIFAQETQKGAHETASQMGFVGRDIVGDPIRLTSLDEAAAWGNRDDLVRFVGILSAVVVLTLLIACFNLANLLLIRNSDRALELSVRSSLGASRARLVQQLAVESLLLGLAGAATGLLLGRAGTRLVTSFALPGGIRLQDVALGLNGRVLSATIALGMLTTLIFGLAPIVHASRTNLVATLRTARSTMRADARAILLGCEIALSIVLLVAAGLFIRTLRKALETNLGFDAAPLAAVRVNPSISGYSGAQLAEYYRGIVERASLIPGVTGVAMGTHVPLAEHGQLPFVPAEKSADGGERAGDQVSAGWVYASPTYFAVLGIPVVAGRAFTPDDAPQSDSLAIINQAAAHALFPDGHPVGRHIVHAGMMRFRIVGVVRDTKYSSVGDDRVPMVFTPMAPDFNDDVNLIVRSQKPAAALDALRRLVQAMPPHPPVQDARLVADQVNTVLEPQRFGATLLAMYSMLALVIASVGVYGVLAYIVEGRKREIGIRIALGARPGKVVELITTRLAGVAITGVLVGLLASTFATRALSRFLYGVSAVDIPTFAVAAAVMLLATLCACVLPSLRALRIDPATAMRLE